MNPINLLGSVIQITLFGIAIALLIANLVKPKTCDTSQLRPTMTIHERSQPTMTDYEQR